MHVSRKTFRWPARGASLSVVPASKASRPFSQCKLSEILPLSSDQFANRYRACRAEGGGDWNGCAADRRLPGQPLYGDASRGGGCDRHRACADVGTASLAVGPRLVAAVVHAGVLRVAS